MGTENKVFSIASELRALPADVAEVAAARLGELDAALRQTSPYTMRDDSRLAYRFVMGNVRHMAPWDVVHEMACTQFLCDALPYQDMQQPYLRGLADEMKQMTGASWTQVWNAVSELGPEMLKCQLMSRTGMIHPDFLPTPEK